MRVEDEGGGGERKVGRDGGTFCYWRKELHVY